MSSWIWIYPIAGGAITFVALQAACWLWDRWKTVFGGMYDYGELIADQGDDWAPWPAPDTRTIRVKIRERRDHRVAADAGAPAWHSAVGVELVCKEATR